MKIDLCQTDITALQVEAIVSPANSQLTMSGGLAGLIRKKGGEEIYEAAVSSAPLPVGKTIVTTAGSLPAKFVIHAPTMEHPGEEVSKEQAAEAMQAILDCAEEQGIKEVAVPGLGTGVGNLSYHDAAKAMLKVVKKHSYKRVERLILVAVDEELYKAFRRAL